MKKICDWKVIFSLEILMSIIFIGFIGYTAILPMKYFIVLIGILVLLNILMFFFVRPSKKTVKQTRSLFGKLVSVLVSISLIMGTLFVVRGHLTLKSLSDAKTEITRYSVYVLKDDPAQTIQDVKNKKIAMNLEVDQEKTNQAKNTVLTEVSVLFKDYSEFNKMVDDLYHEDIDALYMNEAYTTMFEESHPDFDKETKIIYTCELENEVASNSKDVDVTKNPFVVYISGIDTYGKVSTVSRSDVNMMVTVNPQTKQVLMTSLPRDCYVELANKGKKDKLTHSGLAGIENTIQTVENFIGVDINYYMRINFTSLIEIVDALGGITVDIPKNFTSRHGMYFHQGKQVLNGEQALAYSRERYAFGGGDGARVKHQQQVLTAMIEKLLSPSVIKNYNRILKAVDGSFETNMASSDIVNLIKMQLSDNASWTIQQEQIQGKGQKMMGGAYMPNNRLYYLVPNEESVAENKTAILQIMNGKK